MTDMAAPYASMDIGTNSVKLTVADLSGGQAQVRFDGSQVTRLGEGMQPHLPRLREVPIRRTLDAMAEFAEIARQHGAQEIVAVGTAALREAENRDEFLQRAEERTGVRVEVIPGEEEARLSYLAVRLDPQWRNCSRLFVIDIGGGSTEVIQGVDDSREIAARISIPLGAVRVTENYLRSDPPTVTQLATANEAVQAAFASLPFVSHLPETGVLVGVGGTLTNLASMSLAVDGRNAALSDAESAPETLHGYTLTADALEQLVGLLAARTVEERKQIAGLDPRRADVILGGAIVLAQALARLGAASVEVSTRGLRWGLLYDRFL